MSTITRPRNRQEKFPVASYQKLSTENCPLKTPPRKSEETLTQFAERLWERRRKEFQREIQMILDDETLIVTRAYNDMKWKD